MPELTFDPARLKAVIFDLDGTLYRQAPLRRAMAFRLLKAHALHPLSGIRTARVISAYRHAHEELRAAAQDCELAETQLRLTAERTGYGRDDVARVVERWMDIAALEVLPRYLQPGVHASLLSLRAKELRLGVVSDYPAEAKLRALGIAELFDVVVSAQHSKVGVLKPHPRGLQVALERLAVAPEEAVYVGDRPDVDAAAAAAAGLPCLILSEDGRAGPGVGFAHITSLLEITHRLEPA